MRYRLAVVLLVLLLPAGVAAGAALAQPGPAAAASALEWWPMAEGNYWRYEGFGVDIMLTVTELAPGEWRVDTFTNNFVTQREYYRLLDGDLVVTHREQPAGTVVFDPPQVVIRPPLVPGQTWTWSGALDGQAVAIEWIVMDPETVETPAGTFEAVPVGLIIRSGGETGYLMRWFVQGVGLVREQLGLDLGGTPVLIDLLLADYAVH